MSCNKCNKDKNIVNKHFNLCLICNNERLSESKSAKTYTTLKKNRTFSRTAKKPIRINSNNNYFVKNLAPRKTTAQKIKEDEDFYEKCFNECKEHKCEECGTPLPDTFRDEENKVAARFRYSHIVPKSIAPELRHSTININHLCLKDHTRWENGDKENMNIYSINKERLPKYF